MADSAIRPDASLPELLAERARGASDARLAIDVAGGLLATAVAAVWRPPVWPVLLCAALCFAAYGAWGVADRRLCARELRVRELRDASDTAAGASLLRALRSAAAVVGTLSAAMLVLTLLAILMGRFIS